jgi:hypothetical protein
MRFPSLAVLLGALLLLAGCDDAGSPPQVATIAGTPSAAPSAATGAMIRIDMTPAENEALYRTYYACLAEHGVRMTVKAPGFPKIPDEEEKDNPVGYRACATKEPYIDPLLDKAKNPKYADQFRTWLTCMNEHGVEVSGAWDDDFLKYGKRAPGIDGKKYLEIHRQCDMASYKW